MVHCTSVTQLGWDSHQRPPRSFHHLYSGLLAEKVGFLLSVFENNPCSHLAEQGLSDLPGGRDSAGLSQRLCFQLHLHASPRSSPRHPPAYPRARSHLPVTVTGEDKWPHSGTPCQICLSKTKLCAALREKWLAAAQ